MKTLVENHTSCAICGATSNLSIVGRYSICNSCYYAYNDVHAYSFKPAPDFRGKHDRYFGVELEVVPAYNNDGGKALAVGLVHKSLGDLAYMKRDGSLPYNGFEIVTHPFSLHNMYDNRMFSKLANLPIKSFTEASCGLHVHVSKTGLKALQLAKLVYFFSLPGNDDFLTYIAQRDWNHYCRKNDYRYMKSDLRGYNDRYHAINFCNAKTIEFRMFKGNAKPSAIYKAIQFCDAILEFCKVTSAARLTWKNFANWVIDMKQGAYKYNHLRRFIEDYRGR